MSKLADKLGLCCHRIGIGLAQELRHDWHCIGDEGHLIDIGLAFEWLDWRPSCSWLVRALMPGIG